jgi:hypothetical protein
MTMTRERIEQPTLGCPDLPDGPVPGLSESGICGEGCAPAHEVERAVQRALLQLPGVRFGSLQIHCVDGGVCLTGTATIQCEGPILAINQAAGQVAGVNRVVNRVCVRAGE